jgi:hypothetical protein
MTDSAKSSNEKVRHVPQIEDGVPIPACISESSLDSIGASATKFSDRPAIAKTQIDQKPQ